jgi:hypothetical protein
MKAEVQGFTSFYPSGFHFSVFAFTFAPQADLFIVQP